MAAWLRQVGLNIHFNQTFITAPPVKPKPDAKPRKKAKPKPKPILARKPEEEEGYIDFSQENEVKGETDEFLGNFLSKYFVQCHTVCFELGSGVSL